jgi:hypothetical protein
MGKNISTKVNKVRNCVEFVADPQKLLLLCFMHFSSMAMILKCVLFIALIGEGMRIQLGV